jgi:hypothetical protein
MHRAQQKPTLTSVTSKSHRSIAVYDVQNINFAAGDTKKVTTLYRHYAQNRILNPKIGILPQAVSQKSNYPNALMPMINRTIGILPQAILKKSNSPLQVLRTKADIETLKLGFCRRRYHKKATTQMH